MARFRLFGAVLALGLAAGTAFAQGTATGTPLQGAPVSLTFLQRPTAFDYARLYPSRAMERGISGHVELDCVIVAGGALNCSVASETPRDLDFGAASLRLSHRFRVATQTSDGQTSEGGHLRLPIDWRLN